MNNWVEEGESARESMNQNRNKASEKPWKERLPLKRQWSTIPSTYRRIEKYQLSLGTGFSGMTEPEFRMQCFEK